MVSENTWSGHNPYYMFGVHTNIACVCQIPAIALIVTGYGAHIEEIERIRERLSGSWPVKLCPLRSLQRQSVRDKLKRSSERNLWRLRADAQASHVADAAQVAQRCRHRANEL